MNQYLLLCYQSIVYEHTGQLDKCLETLDLSLNACINDSELELIRKQVSRVKAKIKRLKKKQKKVIRKSKARTLELQPVW